MSVDIVIGAALGSWIIQEYVSLPRNWLAVPAANNSETARPPHGAEGWNSAKFNVGWGADGI